MNRPCLSSSRGVPDWRRQLGAEHQFAGRRFGHRAHAVTDLGQHRSGYRGSAPASELQLAAELRRRATAALNHLGQRGPNDGAFPAPAREVERRPGDRRNRPPAGSGNGQPFGAFDQHPTGAHAPAVGRNEHVHRTGRAGHPFHPVQVERVQTGDHGAGPGVEQCGLPMVRPVRWRVAELDHTGQQRPPRTSRPAAVAGGGAADSELLQVPGQHHRVGTQRRQLVDAYITGPSGHTADASRPIPARDTPIPPPVDNSPRP